MRYQLTACDAMKPPSTSPIAAASSATRNDAIHDISVPSSPSKASYAYAGIRVVHAHGHTRNCEVAHSQTAVDLAESRDELETLEMHELRKSIYDKEFCGK